jgi:hypothetical protein
MASLREGIDGMNVEFDKVQREVEEEEEVMTMRSIKVRDWKDIACV